MITPGSVTGTGLSNYTITLVNGALTVNPAALTITANNDSKTYGTVKTFASTAFSQMGLVTANGPFFAETGGSWVFVLPPSGNVALRRPVRFGRRNPEQIEVLSGLVAGERILSSGYEQLRKFERVEIEPEKN